MDVQVKSHRKQIEKDQLDTLEKRLEKVGAIVERQAKLNVNKTGGEHPQVQTGRLMSSITHEQTGDTVSIGTNVEYGKSLEFGKSGRGAHPPYPWLFPAVEEKLQEIINMLKGKFTFG